MTMRFLLMSSVFVLSGAIAERSIPCSYWVWEDERSSFIYCEVQNISLSEQYVNERHNFQSTELEVTTVKFVNAGIVSFFPEDMFTDFPKTIGFVLESSTIPVLTEKYFTQKFAPLKFVEIQHNDLEQIDHNALQFLVNLEWVRLASNKIEYLNLKIFNNQPNLKYIDFRNNKISSVIPDFFRGLNQLNQVLFEFSNQCVNSNFQKSDGTLSQLTSGLRECFNNAPDEGLQCYYDRWSDERPNFLYCNVYFFPLTTNNQYKDLGFSGSHQQKIEATEVKFHYAQDVTFLPEDILSQYPNLNGVILENSNLPVINEQLFNKNFRVIKNVEIQKCNVAEIKENALQQLTNLEFLRLANNNIEGIDSPIFQYNTNLKYIDLRGNKIRRLHPKLIANLNRLDQILFSEGNVCANKDFSSADGTLTRLERALKPCFDNCAKTPSCGGRSSAIDMLTCGQQVAGSSLIYDGNKFSRGKYPWMAAFYYNDTFICGGNLVSKKHVLTAAHCIQDKGMASPHTASKSYFLLGKYDLNINEDGSLRVDVEKFIVHPDWNTAVGTKYEGDLAVAVLKNNVVFTEFIIPVCINSASFPTIDDTGKTGTVTGWGTLENNQGLANEAREVNIKVVDSSTCLASGASFFYIFSIQSSFCAGNRDGRGPCKGDSGGGLYIRRSGQWYLVGIVSASLFAEGKCDLNNFVLFTDVAKFELWILNAIVNN